jgi:hypothetical protein
MYNFNYVEWEFILKKITKDISNLGGEYIDMYENNRAVIVRFEIDGDQKCFCFDIANYKRASNVFDNIYGKCQYFLKSYLINGKERAFVGKIVLNKIELYPGVFDISRKEIYPIAFDINKKKYTHLIIDKNGLIDENEMINLLEKETDVEGFDPDFYKELDKSKILEVLFNSHVKYVGPFIMQGLDAMNKLEKESVKTK